MIPTGQAMWPDIFRKGVSLQRADCEGANTYELRKFNRADWLYAQSFAQVPDCIDRDVACEMHRMRCCGNLQDQLAAAVQLA